MKTTLLLLVLCVAGVIGTRAQSTNPVYATTCGLTSVNGIYTYSPGLGYWTNAAVWYLSYYGTNWYLQNSGYNGGAATYQSVGTNVTSAWTMAVGAGYFVTPYPVFTTNAPVFTAPILTTALTNFWPANGGTVSLTASGVTTSNNVLTVTVNSNVVFSSNPTQTNGAIWTLSGSLSLDVSNNLTTAFSVAGNGVSGAAFSTLAGVLATNVNLSVGLSSAGDTNLTVAALQISGQQGVAGVVPIYTWPAAPIGRQIQWQTNTPTIADLGSQKGGIEWCSNGFFFVTGSTNGSTPYTAKLSPP